MKNIIPFFLIAAIAAFSFAVVDYSKAEKQTGATISGGVSGSDHVITYRIDTSIKGVDWIFIQKETKPSFKNFVIVAQRSGQVPYQGVFQFPGSGTAKYRMLVRKNVTDYFYSNVIIVQ